jgi:RecB family exonuclease
VITPRATRLVRVADLRAFRDAIAALACAGEPLDARDRLVVVPTRAAAAHLTRAIEDRVLPGRGAVLLPELVTRDQLYERFAARVPVPRFLNPFEREALLGVACRTAEAGGAPPPFSLRPGLVAEILRFYDDLRRHENDVDAFEARALRILEPGADMDRGAERLVRQTRFLVAAFRAFEAGCVDTGAIDEHRLRDVLLETAAARPWRHVIVTVRDRASDPYGLWNCDFDLLARMPGVQTIDLVVTESCLAGALHERLHRLFPGIEETRWPSDFARSEAAEPPPAPLLVVPPKAGLAHVSRDREEEVGDFARRVRRVARRPGAPALDRIALVVRQPLPYVYLGREVLRSAGVPCQLFDALPLAAEPYAAALDLVFTCVSANFARTPLVSLLQSSHFRFGVAGHPLSAGDLQRLDRALSEAGYLGEVSALDAAVAGWRADAPGGNARAQAAGQTALDVVRELLPLRSTAPVAVHLSTLLEFLAGHDVVPGPDDPLRGRQLRARAAILAALRAIREAHAAYDDRPVDFDHVAAMVRRWIEGQTFAPRAGEEGVHIADAESARYGDFDDVQLAGLVETEWPDRPRRSIFYSPALLHELGWSPDKERVEGARNAFADLLRLPARRLVVSTFTLEDDAVVTPSFLLDEVEASGLDAVEDPPEGPRRVFEWEALGFDPPNLNRLDGAAGEWARHRLESPPPDARHRGATAGHDAAAFSISALERYQDCPFKFFASDVLRLEEVPEDEPALSPRARGRFIHEVFQRFFEAWDRTGDRTITPDRLDEARSIFKAVAEPLLARLPEADASLERTRLFGSAIAVGLVDVVLGIEASRPVKVVERLLEYRLDGEFTLGGADGRRASLRGVADRIDLLEGRRLRVIDYKSGYAPNPKRALQVPVYALSAAERLSARDGRPWAVDEAAYVAFSGKRSLVPVVKAGSPDPDTALKAARTRLFDALDAVARGEFPPRPHDPMICSYCAYASVCRKDYVGDE